MSQNAVIYLIYKPKVYFESDFPNYPVGVKTLQHKTLNLSIQHTGLTRVELLKYLDLVDESGKLPLGYSIDQIKERHKHLTEEVSKMINHYSNLRLLSHLDNQSRNWLE